MDGPIGITTPPLNRTAMHSKEDPLLKILFGFAPFVS